MMKWKCMFALLFAAGNLIAGSDLPAPYGLSESEILPFNGDGWYYNAKPMEKLLKQTKPKVVIELGSWLGKSTRHIAKLIPENSLVYAVDHWEGGLLTNPWYGVTDLLPTLYQQFLSNVIHAKLTHKIIPIRSNTLDAFFYFTENKIVPDIVYVDADHDEVSVYNDISTYYPLVKGHGIICGDDWGWGGANLPVQKAVKRFAKENNLRIEVPNGWMWILYEN